MGLAALTLRSQADRKRVEIPATVSIISPVFGGGVHVDPDPDRRQIKTPDPLTPLRGAALRGQLRFFWRATTGCRLGSLPEMREAEAALFGAASKPGTVSLRIEDATFQRRPIDVYEMRQSERGTFNPSVRREPAGLREIAYGAFPLQPRGGQEQRLDPGQLFVMSGNARLVLSCPTAAHEEIALCLHAWLAFGGIGGRTRRGFGAVSSELLIDPLAVLQRVPQGRALPGVPALGAASSLKISAERFPSALEALRHGLGALQRFRQAPGVGRNPPAQTPGNKKPAGRSRWPEAERIRKLTGQGSREHSVPLVKVDKFPRAAFGLPIIFHFQGKGEPEDATLSPADHERLASPLILRPFRWDGAFYCLALVLESGHGSLALRLSQSKPKERSFAVQAALSAEEAQRIQPLAGEPDPLAAFLSFFR